MSQKHLGSLSHGGIHCGLAFPSTSVRVVISIPGEFVSSNGVLWNLSNTDTSIEDTTLGRLATLCSSKPRRVICL